MKRRTLLHYVVAAAACHVYWLTNFARAQSPTHAYLVGVLFTNAPSNDRLGKALSEGLRQLGYIEGRDIKIEYRTALGHLERLPALAQELVSLNVQVRVVATEAALLAAKEATTTIPIIIQLTDYDPVAAGLIKSLSRPGGNITGIFTRAPELIGKRLELLKEAVPNLTHVAVLYESYGERQRKDAQSAAHSLGVQLDLIELGTSYDYKRALRTAKEKNVGAVLLLYSPRFYPVPRSLVQQCIENKLPIVGYTSEYAREGFLMSYGVEAASTYKRLGYFIDRVLKGTKPSDLPVEQPDTFGLAVNLKTAGALGITLPESVLLRASEVIR